MIFDIDTFDMAQWLIRFEIEEGTYDTYYMQYYFGDTDD